MESLVAAGKAYRESNGSAAGRCTAGSQRVRSAGCDRIRRSPGRDSVQHSEDDRAALFPGEYRGSARQSHYARVGSIALEREGILLPRRPPSIACPPSTPRRVREASQPGSDGGQRRSAVPFGPADKKTSPSRRQIERGLPSATQLKRSAIHRTRVQLPGAGAELGRWAESPSTIVGAGPRTYRGFRQSSSET